MSILRRALHNSAQKRTGITGVPIPSNLEMGFGTSTGILVTDEVALGLPIFYRGIAILSSSVSTLPLKAYQMVDGLRTEVATQPQIITDPFANATLIEGLDQVMISMLLRGNAYCAITSRDRMLRPEALTVLPPDLVRMQRDPATNLPFYVIGSENYDPSVMVHLKNMVPPGADQGLSLVKAQKSLLGLAAAGEEYAGKFYSNGATQSGFISVSEAMEPEDARRLNEEFKSRHAGLKQAWNPGVLTGGATWVPTSIAPDDAQFLESRQFTDSRMATMLGIPPHMLGMVDRTTSWGTGIEVQGRAFVDFTLRNYLTRIEQAFTSMLPAGQWAEFDTDQLTRADTATRYANYAIATQNGWLSIDEVRAAEGDAPLPDDKGADYYHLSTLVAVDAEPPAAPVIQMLPGVAPPTPVADPDNPSAVPADE